MTTKHFAAVIFMLVIASAVSVRADFFQYTDDSGTVVIVDDAGKIPSRFRHRTRCTTVDAESGGRSTGVTIRKNRVYVPVTLSYHGRPVEATLLLDTGASTTMITTQLADRLGISPAQTVRQHAQVADGRVLETYLAKLDSLSVGPKVKHDMEVNIMPMNGPPLGADGLLGMNFLGEFSYHLDRNTQSINWMH
jgi:clan AA aspartic protease (TIGR02281 family)